MYDIIRSVLDSGRYELADMLAKIDTIWLQGDLTDGQRTALVELARTNADPTRSYAPAEERLEGALAAIRALEGRVAALEAGGSGEAAGDSSAWPEWVQPTGAHDAYQSGDQITFNGKHYVSRMDNNVWSPSVYPAGWEEIL